uniref:Uncharacterized protein n=1 Tax=Psilocybe cubensis TaxID=181762 RepID=A0A8H7Y5X9_PSICU
MPSASGILRRIGVDGGSKFMATFTIRDSHYTLAGLFVSGLPDFRCRHAKLKYHSVSQLTSTRLAEGRIGPDGIILRLINGPIIEGLLESPFDPPANELIGCGIWFQH